MHCGPSVTVLLPSRDFQLIYPELFNYNWWDGGGKVAASGPQPGALTERKEERHEKEVRVRDGASERERGQRRWGGFTVEQKNYRALIMGTSLETETRERDGFTASIIGLQTPPHWSSQSEREIERGNKEEKESGWESHRASPAWEAPSSPIHSNDLSTDSLCALKEASPWPSPLSAHTFISICLCFSALLTGISSVVLLYISSINSCHDFSLLHKCVVKVLFDTEWVCHPMSVYYLGLYVEKSVKVNYAHRERVAMTQPLCRLT